MKINDSNLKSSKKTFEVVSKKYYDSDTIGKIKNEP